MTKLAFPKDFLWGGASWATGFEGAREADGKTFDVWDRWHKENPEVFFDKVGPDNGIDMYYRYKEYVALLKKLNINSFRFSVSWSRFIPNGIGEVNQKAVAFYQNLIDELKANDIEPIMCLYHFDLPIEIQDMGGWMNREIIPYFITYVKEVLHIFGSQLPYIMVHNEVGVQPQMGYLYGYQPPCIKDFKKSLAAGYNLLVAQAKAIELYREMGFTGEIGTILNPNPVYPKSNQQDDVEAAKFVDMIRERFYLDISVLGEIPQDFLMFVQKYDLKPDMQEEDIELFKENTVDILGVNYYQPCRVKAPTKKWDLTQPIMPEKFFELYEWPERVMNTSRGWEIYPKGIYDTMMRLKKEYHNIKFFIGENGMGVEKEELLLDSKGQVQDDYRINFYREHLSWLHKGIEEGSNCIGYNVWSPFDNWSPVNAFKNRYGFYRFDLETKKMTMKKSGEWFSQVCKSNSLEE